MMATEDFSVLILKYGSKLAPWTPIPNIFLLQLKNILILVSVNNDDEYARHA